jgi:protein phosphatase
MAIIINNQSFFSEVGKRANNEDNGGWNEGSTYIVCDGVGGNERGEIASEIITSTFLQIYKDNPLTPVNLALQKTEAKLTDYITQNPESLGMASTLVMASVLSNGLLVAWVGDSRVYQFRNGEVIFKTTDHSWVNEALAAGILTSEEALNHPKSNIITRAIQGQHKPVEAQEAWLSDIKKDDFFLLCSDVFLETWSDEELLVLFASKDDVESIANKIKEECLQTSKDNNTAIIFKIEDVHDIEVLNPKSTVDNRNEHLVKTEIQDSTDTIHQHQKKSVNYKKLIYVLLLIIGAFVLSKMLSKGDKKPEVTPSELIQHQVGEKKDSPNDGNTSEETNTSEDQNNSCSGDSNEPNNNPQ